VHDSWVDDKGRSSAPSFVDLKRVAFGTATFLTSRWRQRDGRSAGTGKADTTYLTLKKRGKKTMSILTFACVKIFEV
jgi:hypothetical protein